MTVYIASDSHESVNLVKSIRWHSDQSDPHTVVSSKPKRLFGCHIIRTFDVNTVVTFGRYRNTWLTLIDYRWRFTWIVYIWLVQDHLSNVAFSTSISNSLTPLTSWNHTPPTISHHIWSLGLTRAPKLHRVFHSYNSTDTRSGLSRRYTPPPPTTKAVENCSVGGLTLENLEV